MSDHQMKLGDLDLTKNAVCITISRDMAISLGHIKPTPEEVEAYNAESRARWERDCAEWETFDAFCAALSEVDDNVARIVFDLHSPINDDTAECYGCPDPGDNARQSWPCDTVKAVARAVGIEPPEDWFGSRPGPEPHTMPPEGYTPFAPPIPRWHTHAARTTDS